MHLFYTREHNERLYDSDTESLVPTTQAEGAQSYIGNC
jgi:hypothetical protein